MTVSFMSTCGIRICKRRPTDGLGMSLFSEGGPTVDAVVQPGAVPGGLLPEDIVLLINGTPQNVADAA